MFVQNNVMYVCDKLQGCSIKNDWVINILYFVCIQFGNIAGADMIDMYEEICKKHKFQRKYFLIYSMLFYQKISL